MTDAFYMIVVSLGSGFAFAVGFIVGVAMTRALGKTTKSVESRSLALLEARNAIGEREATALEAMVELKRVARAESAHDPLSYSRLAEDAPRINDVGLVHADLARGDMPTAAEWNCLVRTVQVLAKGDVC